MLRPNRPEFDVLVAGELNPDLILSDPDLEPRFGQVETLVRRADLTVGSSSAIFACGAARLGLCTAFVGVVGDDEFGRFMCRALAAAGIDVSHVVIDASQRTGLSVILSRGPDRAILTFPGAIAALRAEQVPATLLGRARHLHVASFFLQTALQPGLPSLFKQAHAYGLTTSLDPNWDPTQTWAGLDELLPLTDIFLPNEAEALAISQTDNLDQALDHLRSQVRMGAIKLGAQGALGWCESEHVGVGALPVDVVDTVGAGDSFDAGFVCGYLRGWDLRRCLQLAVACGSLSTRAAGGTAGQPTLAEAMQILEDRADGPSQ